MHLFVNMLLARQMEPSIEAAEEAPQTHLERVLWIDPTNTFLVTIDSDISHRKAWPIMRGVAAVQEELRSGAITFVKEDPYQYIHQPDEAFQPAHCEQRDQAWKVIEQILDKVETPGALFDHHVLGPLIQEAHEQTGMAKTTLYRLFRYYWQKGQVPNALLPNYDRCGAPGQERKSGSAKRGAPSETAKEKGVPTGVNIDAEVKAIFHRSIKLFYETRECKTLKEAWLRTLMTFFYTGYEEKDGVAIPILPPWEELPTLNQFRYWYHKERNPVRATIKRDGAHAYNVKNRAALGSLKLKVFGPGSLYLIDATVGDIYLVSEMNRNRIIGRPVIYIIVDVFSGLIVGMSVSLEGPSWVGAMQALENMALDKVEFCKEYGRTILPEQWPSHHIPRAILADRGELLSEKVNEFIKAYHIKISHTAPYRPDWKGCVERHFRLLNDLVIRWQPGAVREREPGRKDFRLDAKLTLRGFRRLLIDCIIEHNTIHQVSDEHIDLGVIEDEVDPYPCELWKWGINNRSGILRDESRENLRHALMPRDKAMVTRDGIHFNDLHYTCELAEREDWFGAIHRGKRSWPAPVMHDPRSTDNIYLILEKGKHIEPCTLLDKERRFRGWDWFDVRGIFRRP